jgi:hypothetical protein
VCLNNLRAIGGVLVERQLSGVDIRRHSGASFLLQIAPVVKDSQLSVFLCPEEPAPPDRPAPGTPEFVEMYRSVEDLSALDEAALRRMCSYAGPDWEGHPFEPEAVEFRLWAADACFGGRPHHRRGLVVLYDNGATVFLETERIASAGEDRVVVGPDSPDPRLRTLCFLPRQR